MNMCNLLIGLGIGLIAGLWIGWVQAHHTVATECRRLGGFFVGTSIFKCTEVVEPKSGYPFPPPNPHRKEEQ